MMIVSIDMMAIMVIMVAVVIIMMATTIITVKRNRRETGWEQRGTDAPATSICT